MSPRIVSLLPAATEILGRLGLSECVVGISHECDVPGDVLDRPRLTSTTMAAGLSPAEIDQAVVDSVLAGRPLYAVDADAISALQPDLVITQGVCSVCAVSGDQVAPLHSVVDRIITLGAMDMQGMLADVQTIAAAAGVPERGEALCATLMAEWKAIVPAEPTRALFVEWSEPLWHGGHWVPEQLAAAGAVDVMGAPGAPSRRGAWAEAQEAAPDVVIVGCCGFDLAQNVAEARRLPDWATRVLAVDANRLFSRPAPAIVAGAQLLASALRCEPVDPALAHWVRR